MTDRSHLEALENRLFREAARRDEAMASLAKTTGKRNRARVQVEIDFRIREVASVKKEIAAERNFLGLPKTDPDAMSIDEILAELEG